jgi:hypothetical protein
MAWCLIKTTTLYIEAVSVSIYIATPFFSIKMEAASSSEVLIPMSQSKSRRLFFRCSTGLKAY